MTPRQKAWYFTAFRKACETQGWVPEKGRISNDAAAGELADDVWTVAEIQAREAHRAVGPSDLRHAVHVVALGRDCSSTQIKSGREFGRLRCVLQLLADPDNVQAMMEWCNADIDTRRRLEWRIGRHQPGYVARISSDKFGTSNTASLTLDQLQQLAMTLDNRRRRAGEKASECVSETAPF